MYQPQIAFSIVWWSFGLFRIPHRSFDRWREPPSYGLACLLWCWDTPSPRGAGVPDEDAQFQTLPQGCYKE